MSDAKDDPDSDLFQESEEIKAINFEWTPELVKIGTSNGTIIPSIGPVEKLDFARYVYHPGMALPDPADTQECLKWAGLSDEKSIEVIQKFRELYPDYQGPSCGYDEKHSQVGMNSIMFPVVDKMLQVFLREMVDVYSDDFIYTHGKFWPTILCIDNFC